MALPPISIINHIPNFLTYLNAKNYSQRTCENYGAYLQKFIRWLNENKKTHIRPHELEIQDIDAYKAYLAHIKDDKGNSLKLITQNYYLIALRALLGYFVAKDIVSAIWRIKSRSTYQT